MDEMLTILPARWRFITGTTAWVNRNVPVRLKCRSCCHSASVRSSTLAAGLPMMVEPPTALTRISMRPCASVTRRTTSSTWAASSPSAGMPWAVPPPARIAPTTDSSASLSLSTAITVPPSRPMISADSRPMPRPAALMSAMRPENRIRLVPIGRGAAIQPAQQARPRQAVLAAVALALLLHGRRVALVDDGLVDVDQLAAARLGAHLDRARLLQVVHPHECLRHALPDGQQAVVAQDERRV